MAERNSSSKDWYKALEWFVAIALAVLIAVGIRTFLFVPYQVHGASMEPTLKGDELLIVNKLVYHLDEPDYGEIVVFHTSEERDFIKRVIGLPGDHIVIRDGKVYRNDKLLTEPYIYEQMNTNIEEDIIVPPSQIYVMGDNRNNSKDSRRIGPVLVDKVVGRADLVVWPLDRIHLLALLK